MKRSRVAIGFVVVGLATAGLVLTRPSRVHVERTQRIHATPAALYARVSDFAEWRSWTPWPELTRACGAPTSGPGATCEGGTARLTMVRVQPDARVELTIEFPTQSSESGQLALALVAAGDDTDVTWSFDASSSFGEDTLGGPRDLQTQLGADFERALAGLARATTPSAEPPSPSE